MTGADEGTRVGSKVRVDDGGIVGAFEEGVKVVGFNDDGLVVGSRVVLIVGRVEGAVVSLW